MATIAEGQRGEAWPPAETYVTFHKLVAATNKSFSIPTGAKRVRITADVIAYMRPDSALAAVPSADITDGTSPQVLPAFVPMTFTLNGTETNLNFYAAGTPGIVCEWFF